MPQDKSGKFHMNPQVARMHDKPASLDKPSAGPGATEGPEDEPAKGHVEVHGHGGGFHTITHQPHEMQDGEAQEDGSVKHDHADLESVRGHMESHFGPEEAMEEEVSPGIHSKVAAMQGDDGGY